MRYKISLFSLFFTLLLNSSKIKAQFVPCERTYTVHFNPLLRKITQLTDFNGSITLVNNAKVLPMIGTSFAPNAQELFKNNGKVYLFIAQTGFIFQMSEPVGDSVVFRKIDNTININYNIDCTNFIYKDQIYNYGGYGFWTKTAHVRKFNTVDQEWDIIPTNIEVYTADYDWFSPTEGKLYVPFQKFENKGVKDPVLNNGVFDYTSYYLDVKTAEWVKIGKLSNELIKLIDKKSNYGTYEYDNGRIFLINDEVYLFDYVHNKIYKSKKADLNDFQLLDFPIWGFDYKILWVFIVLGFAIVLILVFGWFFNRSVRKKIEKAQLKALKSKSINQAFTEIELGLIQLLLDAYDAKRNVEIAEINHVLGIKDKNIGLQKKVRSDVMNSINDKYFFITQGDIGLIGSIRKEDDKRFFEYFINDSEVKTVQKLIEKN